MQPYYSNGVRRRGRKRASRKQKKKPLSSKPINSRPGIWRCKKEELSSYKKCQNNAGCPCGEWCRLRDRKCVRATCNGGCDGKKSEIAIYT